MSNINPASYFELDVNAPLFRALKEENPDWWRIESILSEWMAE